MSIVITIIGCLLGVVCYLLLALVTPVKNLGEYSVGLIVALCLIWVEIVGYAPFWAKRVP